MRESLRVPPALLSLLPWRPPRRGSAHCVTAVPSLACHSAGGHRPLAGSGPWAERAAEHFVVILTNAAADLLDESGNNRRDNLSNRAPFLRELLNTSNTHLFTREESRLL